MILDPPAASRQSAGPDNLNGPRPRQPVFRPDATNSHETKTYAPNNGMPPLPPDRTAARLPQAVHQGFHPIPQQPHTPVPAQRAAIHAPNGQNMRPPHNAGFVQQKAPPQHVQSIPRNGVNQTTSTSYPAAAPLPQNPTTSRPRSRGGGGSAVVAGESHQATAAKRVEPPTGFFSAGVAMMLQESNASVLPADAPTFNPHAESPSIRKTSGVDHSRSKPVNKQILGNAVNHPDHPNHLKNPSPAVSGGGALNGSGSNLSSRPQQQQQQHPQQQYHQHRTTNLVNPHLDMTRKIGMPNNHSPLQNRGAYKPPGPAPALAPTKRVLDGTGAAVYVTLLYLSFFPFLPSLLFIPLYRSPLTPSPCFFPFHPPNPLIFPPSSLLLPDLATSAFLCTNSVVLDSKLSMPHIKLTLVQCTYRQARQPLHDISVNAASTTPSTNINTNTNTEIKPNATTTSTTSTVSGSAFSAPIVAAAITTVDGTGPGDAKRVKMG